MGLEITNIHAQIGIIRHDAVIDISHQNPKVEIDKTPSELQIEINHPQIKIDQSQCFSESGLKSISELIEEAAQEGLAAAVEYAGKIVDEGNRMAMINNKANAFAEIAVSETLPPPQEYNVTLMPTSRPRIDVEGDISMDNVVGKLNFQVTDGALNIEVSSPTIEFYMQQKPEIHINFVGSNLDINA